MRVTYLTGQAPASVDLGPIVVPGGAASLPVGVEGQIVGYDADGNPVAVTLPEGTLPAGAEGQLVGYGPGGLPVAVDAPDGSAYDDTAIVGRVAAVEAAIEGIPAPYDDTALTGRVQTLENEPAPSWSEVTGKPTTFAPTAHGHAISDIAGLRAELDAVPSPYDDAALSGRVDAVEADLAAIPAPYDDTTLAGRVTEVEADVVTAQSRADAAYSLAQQGGGTGSYDDTELRGRIVTLENEPAPAWTEVTGKPTSFPPSPHSHAIADVSGLQAELDAIPPAYDDAALSGRVTALEEAPAPSWDDVTGKPTTFTPSTHEHSIAEVSGLSTALDGKAAASHTHAWADVTGKPTTFAPSAHTHDWDEVTGKPTTFAPSAHGHSIAEVSGLQTALDGKLPTTTFKTVNSQTITGSGNIVTAQSFATDAEALAYSTANPGVVAFSRQV